MSKTINIEMTWQNVMHSFILLLESGDAEGKALARDELIRCAKLADKFVELNKQKETL